MANTDRKPSVFDTVVTINGTAYVPLVIFDGNTWSNNKVLLSTFAGQLSGPLYGGYTAAGTLVPNNPAIINAYQNFTNGVTEWWNPDTQGWS